MLKGLDKTVLYHIKITNYDLFYLKKLNDGKKVKLFTGIQDAEEDEKIEHLQIADTTLGFTLKYGYVIEKKRKYWYTYLALITPEGKNNLIPKSNEELVEKYLPIIKSLILEKYRINLDFTEAKYRQLEFNFTFKLQEPYQNYGRVFSYLQKYAVRYFTHANNPRHHNNDSSQSYYLTNKSRSMKIYRKNIEGEGEYCRIEYSLFDADKIKSALGTNELSKIKDSTLQQYFLDQFERDIIKPGQKALQQHNKEIKKQLMKLKNLGIKGVLSLGWELDAKQILLDIEQLEDALREVDKNNACRTIKHFKQEVDLEPLRGNLIRLQEIMQVASNVDTTVVIEYIQDGKVKKVNMASRN